jgi:hypothetical protein
LYLKKALCFDCFFFVLKPPLIPPLIKGGTQGG